MSTLTQTPPRFPASLPAQGGPLPSRKANDPGVAKLRSVLVTGGGSGIGLAIARGFAAQGHCVLISGSRPNMLQIAADMSSPPQPVHSYVADLADEEQTLALANYARTLFDGGCDVLVNCAGYSQKRDGEAIPPHQIVMADWARIFQINLASPFLLCRELIPAMRRRGWGRVVNIASRSGRTYQPTAGADYAAAKAGMIGLTRHLAGCYAGDGITINAVAPGRIDTPLSNTSSEAVKVQAALSVPVGRLGKPDEVAAAVLFLSSEAAGYITGACLDINGGVLMA